MGVTVLVVTVAGRGAGTRRAVPGRCVCAVVNLPDGNPSGTGARRWSIRRRIGRWRPGVVECNVF